MSSHAFQTVPDQFRGSLKEEFLIPPTTKIEQIHKFRWDWEKVYQPEEGREQSQRETLSLAVNDDKVYVPEHY